MTTRAWAGSCLFTLACCAVAAGFDEPWTEQYPKETAAANSACEGKRYAECREHLLRLRALLDGRADIVYRLAGVEAMLENPKAAVDWLEIYSKAGLDIGQPASDPEFVKLREDPRFAPMLARIESAQRPVSHSTPVYTLPEADLISEDIAYDPATRRFFISSVRHRNILAMDANGKFSEFVTEGQDGVWAILALAVDPHRKWLWASTAALAEARGHAAADDGRSALLKYNLENGKLVKRYDVTSPGKHALGDMTISRAGDVIVSDGYGAVYNVDHARDELELLVGPGVFRSPQTPALSADGRRLFVPDYSRGIGILDLRSKQVRLLEHPPELSLGGIDGLYVSGRTMLAVQNGTNPPRLIRMTLDRASSRVTAWEIVESRSPGLGAPTHGVIVGRDFYFLVNSGWDKMEDSGEPKAGAVFERPAIWRTKVE